MSDGHTHTVLVVDDNPATRYAVARVLRSAGLATEEAETGGGALDLLRTLRPDLIVLDVRLPDMLGFEVCQRIKADPETNAIPVLHVSASYMQDEHKVHGLEGGADGYLTHPVEPTVLLATVHSLLRIRDTEDALRRLNEGLERRVAERTAVAEQRASQIRALASGLSQAERRERRRLSQLLHDHVQQLLVAAKLQVGLLQKRTGEDTTREAAKRVESLLDDALAESRSLNTQLSPRILFESGLGAALQWLGDEMREKYGLSVATVMKDGSEVEAEDVRAMAFEAVRELLFNVVKHAGVTEAAVRVYRAGAALAIDVEDRGAGFDLEMEPLDRRARLGLAGVRQRLELVGGRLEVQSAVGKGTTVTLTIPLAEDAPPDEEPASNGDGRRATRRAPGSDDEHRSPEHHHGPIRVVVADDHKVVREGLMMLLEAHPGIQIVGEAADGEEAVRVAKQMCPDVVLMDVSMPVLGGIDATRRLTLEAPSIAVVALSMHDEPDITAAMLEAGAATFVAKGSASEVLVDAMQRTVRGTGVPKRLQRPFGGVSSLPSRITGSTRT